MDFDTNLQQNQHRSATLRDYSTVPKTPLEEATATRLCFAFGRFRAINSILSFDHRGPCRTDDGEMWLDLLLPYAVEISSLKPEFDFDGAMSRVRYWLPKICADLDRHGLADRWDDLCNLRSIASSRRRVEAEVGHVDWLPTAEKIRTETCLTRAKHTAINSLYPDRPPLRGIGVIDPPTPDELREIKRLQAEARRRAQGVMAQSERTATADAAALAKVIGCNEKTIRRHIKAGSLASFLEKRGQNVQNLSPPYILDRRLHILDISDDNEADVTFTKDDALFALRDLLGADDGEAFGSRVEYA